MLLPILLVQSADDDSLAGTGMDELAVFQIDAYMGGPLLFPAVVEEYQVTFFQLSFLDFPAILFALVFGVAFEFLPIYFFIYGGCQARTIHTSLGRSSTSIGDTYPVG